MKLNIFTPLLGVALLSGVHAATVIDDFSGDLSEWTASRILKATEGADDNTYQWEIDPATESLRIVTTAYGGIEQYALTRNGSTLSIGQELQATYAHDQTDSQDIGLYVGAATPAVDVRADYLNIYVRDTGQLYARGFDDTTEVGLAGGDSPTLDTLFIARIDESEFELGYYSGGTRTVLTTRIVASTEIGNTIGFYADVRGAGTRGSMDNLMIIPEPSTALLGVLASLTVLGRRRRLN